MNYKPIKVVFFKKVFPQLTENWICNQVTGLNRISTKFYCVFRNNIDSHSFNNIRCLWEDLNYFHLLLNRIWNKLFHWYPQFLLWFRKDRPNIIHAHFGECAYDILPYARWLNIPLVTSFYGYDAYGLPQEQPYWHNRYKTLFKQGRLFLAEGPAMRKKLIELGCPSEKIIVHHIGVKLRKYKFQIRKPNSEIRIIVCGRFVEKKGIPYAIEAFKRLKSKTKIKVRLTIAGDSDSEGTLTDEKKNILNSIEKYNVTESVTITGYIPHNDLLELAYAHHILLAPSIHASDGDAEGGFPVFLTEMLATGMPVVAFNHCDIPEIIQNGKSGFLVAERDTDALAEKLIYLLEHPEVWPEIGRAGRAFVEQHYNIDKLNCRLIEIYQDIFEN